MHVAVLLAGSGVYDGSEIHEAVFSLLAIARNGGSYQCIAPNREQYHVVDHLTGEPHDENRNILVESARIARGQIIPVDEVNVEEFDALVIPGGFGAAKNLNSWAIEGPEGTIFPEIEQLIVDFYQKGKPIVAMCMGPTVVAKAFENKGIPITLTVGSTEAPSPYDINAISKGLSKVGAKPVMKTVHQIAVDYEHKVITAPCYMMDATILEVHENVEDCILKLQEMLDL